MFSCWNIHPRYRPSFESLEKSISKLLEKCITGHYIDLNEPYVNINSNNIVNAQNGQSATNNDKGYISLQSQKHREHNMSNESIDSDDIFTFTSDDEAERYSLRSTTTDSNASDIGHTMIVPTDEIQIHSIPKQFIESTKKKRAIVVDRENVE